MAGQAPQVRHVLCPETVASVATRSHHSQARRRVHPTATEPRSLGCLPADWAVAVFGWLTVGPWRFSRKTGQYWAGSAAAAARQASRLLRPPGTAHWCPPTRRESRPVPGSGRRIGTSDVNRKPKIWYTKKIPIPNRYLVFLFQISWYFLGILSVF